MPCLSEWEKQCEDLCEIIEGIRFRDVAGEDEAKENLSEIVEYLHNPARYKEIGASMPKKFFL